MNKTTVIFIYSVNRQKSGLQNLGVQTNPNRLDYKITNFGGFCSLTVRQTRYMKSIPPTRSRLSIFKRIGLWIRNLFRRKKFIATIKDQTKNQNIVLGYLHARQSNCFYTAYSETDDLFMLSDRIAVLAELNKTLPQNLPVKISHNDWYRELVTYSNNLLLTNRQREYLMDTVEYNEEFVMYLNESGRFEYYNHIIFNARLAVNKEKYREMTFSLQELLYSCIMINNKNANELSRSKSCVDALFIKEQKEIISFEKYHKEIYLPFILENASKENLERLQSENFSAEQIVQRINFVETIEVKKETQPQTVKKPLSVFKKVFLWFKNKFFKKSAETLTKKKNYLTLNASINKLNVMNS